MNKGLIVALGVISVVYANNAFCLTGEEFFQMLEKRYRWDKIRDMDIVGVVYVTMEKGLSPFQKVRVMLKGKDKVRIVTRIMDTDLETIVIKNGDHVWMSSPFGEFEEISLSSEQEEGFFSYYYGILKRRRMEIEEETNDFYIVHIEPGITGWIDKKDLLLRKLRDKKRNFTTLLLDYRERNGFWYPCKIITEDENGVVVFKIEVKTIKFNSGISDKAFGIPF
ncbi:MAG: hypothetical protein QME40_03730 [bacterium]|nr:hypothetical protein [bacterium]